VDDVAAWENAWETLVLSLIGESLPQSELINGAYLTDKTRRDRVMYRLEIWSSDWLSDDSTAAIKDTIREARPKPLAIKG